MSNTSNTIDPQCYGDLNHEISILLTVLNIVFGILSSAGNLLVLLAIYKTPALRTVSNYFLASVALADFITGSLVHPMLAIRCYKNYWKSENPFAKAADIMVLQTVTATSFGLCAIAVDRYFAITATFRYQWVVTTRVCILATACIWIVSLSYPFVRFVTTDVYQLPEVWLLVCIFSVGIPFLVIAYCYFRILLVVREQKKKIAAQTIDGENAISFAKQNKAACTVGIVIGIVLLFWSPALIISIVQVLGDRCLKTKIMKAWFWGIFCAMANSSLNPWLYAARMNDFRKAMKKILTCRH